MINGTAGRASIRSECCFPLAPGEPAGPPVSEGLENDAFELGCELERVPIYPLLLIHRDWLAENIRSDVGQTGSTVGVRRTDGDPLASNPGTALHPGSHPFNDRIGDSQVVDGNEHRSSVGVRADRECLGPQFLLNVSRLGRATEVSAQPDRLVRRDVDPGYPDRQGTIVTRCRDVSHHDHDQDQGDDRSTHHDKTILTTREINRGREQQSPQVDRGPEVEAIISF